MQLVCVPGAQRGRGAQVRRVAGRRRRRRGAAVARQEEVHALPHGVPHRHRQRQRTRRDAASVLHADHMQ